VGQNLSSGNVKDAAVTGETTVNAWAVVIDLFAGVMPSDFWRTN